MVVGVGGSSGGSSSSSSSSSSGGGGSSGHSSDINVKNLLQFIYFKQPCRTIRRDSLHGFIPIL